MTERSDPSADPGLDTNVWYARLARRAYEIWEREGRPEGRALDHWMQAERELSADQDLTLTLGEGEISSLGEVD
jgi:hypothetical protein